MGVSARSKEPINIQYIKIVVEEIVEEYFNNSTKSVIDIISEMRNKYDCH